MNTRLHGIENINIAVIGTGHLGSIHAKLWAAQPSANLAVLFDKHLDRAQNLAVQLTALFPAMPPVRVATSLDEALESADAVTIATPTSTHFDVALKALGAGKHCFIEKPVTANFHETQELALLAEKFGLRVHVGYVERFNPAFVALRNIEQRTNALRPMFIEAERRAPFKPRATDVSVVLDLMIHDIDLALSLIQSPVRAIHASGVQMLTDFADIASVRISFENGAVAQLAASRVSPKSTRTMQIFEKKRWFSLDFAAPSLDIFYQAERHTQAQVVHQKMLPATILGEIGAENARKTILHEKPTLPRLNAISEEQRLFVEAIIVSSDIASTKTESATVLTALDSTRVVEEVERQIQHSFSNLV